MRNNNKKNNFLIQGSLTFNLAPSFVCLIEATPSPANVFKSLIFSSSKLKSTLNSGVWDTEEPVTIATDFVNQHGHYS